MHKPLPVGVDIYKTMDNLWNVMFFTGYFRKDTAFVNKDTRTLEEEFGRTGQNIRSLMDKSCKNT